MKLPSSCVIHFLLALAVHLPFVASQRLQCPRDYTSGPSVPNRVNTTQKLIWLRNEMGRVSSVRGPTLDAFIITSDDEHQGEYLASKDKRLEYISGFSGSSGFAVVTRSKAALWTDVRYHRQADQQLDCNWALMRQGEEGVPTLTEWLRRELRHGYRVGADPRIIPGQMWDQWTRELAAERIALIEVHNNLIDLIWTINRPAYNDQTAFIHPQEYAGESWQNKVAMLRLNLTRFDCDAMIVTALEEIAWLLNVRGRDVPYNPFVRSYLIVTKQELHWYLPKEKLSEAVRRQLKVDTYGPFSVRIHSYEAIWGEIRTYSQIWKRVLVPGPCVFSAGASQSIYAAVPPEKRFVIESPIIFLKAKKNAVQAKGMREANVRDSAALVDFLAYLEEEIKNGQNWTEVSVARTLEQYRLEQNTSQGIPFPTVAAFAENGAFLHYEVSNATDRLVNDSSTLVLHGGGHYYDGTSEVTRTLHFGVPTRKQREAYTYVLSGLIQFSTAMFPSTLRTTDIDLIVRSRLWKAGIDYKHNTGHGIGAFSNVRESPIIINYDSIKEHKETFEEGYFFTCDPSYLQQDDFGIKLENILEVISQKPPYTNKQTKYLGFREVTLVPFDPKLIDSCLLSRDEIQWLNRYNQRIMQEVGAELKKQSRMKGFYWLMEKTKDLGDVCSFAPRVLLPSLLTILSVVLCLLYM